MNYKPRPSIDEPREHLLKGGVTFIERASAIPGIQRIAMVGSMTTDKKIPKDIDFLVTVNESIDFKDLAEAGRQLQGYAHRINLTADIFITNSDGIYIGRTCNYKEPFLRRDCQGKVCGHFLLMDEDIPAVLQAFNSLLHLCSDTEMIKFTKEEIDKPPLIIWPEIVRNAPIPEDVENILLKPVKRINESK